MGSIFYIMGKSSSGKDTLYKQVKECIPTLQTIVPYTTRPIRANEQDGVEYFFVNEAKRKQLEETGKIIELRAYNTVQGIWRYFTVDDGQIDIERHNYLVIGTLESYEKMQLYFGKERVVPFYIEVEDGLRLQRALNREREQNAPQYAELCRRFLADEKDFSLENLMRVGIKKPYVNEDLETCRTEIILGIQKKL
ncbi:MAG: guanylate kinase [Lachnospiraceae bacterium]